MSLFLSVVAIYIFILLGYMAKKIFKEQIEEKTLIVLSIYFLQPFLTFWGLTRTPIDFNLLYTPFLYLVIIIVSLVFLMIIGKFMFKDEQDRTIFMTTSLVGNTGNLAIPLGIALFGESSVPYTSIINIANILFIYTLGIYFFARSKYTLRDSIIQMGKMPILWFALFALLFNYFGFTIHPSLDTALLMGAYSSIVIQLLIFGVYLAKTNIQLENLKLIASTSFAKLIFVPLIGVVILSFSGLPNELAYILMVSLLVPLAIFNVNIAALYECKPYVVTAIVLVSTGLFLALIYLDLKFLDILYR